jgi:glycosyltransferase involved in cell wall biosynthesis
LRAPKILLVCAIDSSAWLLLRGLMQAMLARGWEVHVACSDGPNLARLEALGVRTHAVAIARNLDPRAHLRSVLALVPLMRRERFDLVHVHTPIAAMVGRVAARLAGVPVVVYTAHGFYFHERMPAGKRRAHVWLERLLGKLTDFLFTVSGEDAQTAVAEGIMPAERVQFVANGIDIPRFRDVPAADLARWRAQLGLDDQLVIGFVGRLVEEKGIRELVLAFRQLLETRRDLALVLVGSTLAGDRDDFGQELAAMLEDPLLRAHVHFTGFTEDIAPLMKLMDVFVLPSYREGMPLSILEAMAAGRAVVATDIRGCREEVVEGETGFLVPVGDAETLAARLETLAADPALRERMGQAGLQRVAAHFEEHAVNAAICDRLATLLASAPAR